MSETFNTLMKGENVIIEEGVKIGRFVRIYDNVIIRKGAIVGDYVQIGYCEFLQDGITEIGENSKIRSGAVIYHNCKIGNDSSIGHNSIIRENTIIGKNTYIGALVMMEGDTVVGDYCGINAQSHITKFTHIGDYTFFGPSVCSSNDNNMAHKRQGHGQNMKGFTTERYVRIGAGATLLPGVILGEGCIVGAHSTVTKDIPPYSVVYGFPAKIVREAKKEDIIC